MAQKPTEREQKLEHILKTFAGRVERSNDPVVREAAHQMKCELRKVGAPAAKKVK